MAKQKSRRPWWLSIILLVCLLYLAGIAGFFIARAALSHWPPWLALVSTFTPFLFLPLIFVLPLAIWARSKTVGWSALFASGLFLLLYGSDFLTQPAPVSAAANDTLTAMTFNLGAAQAQPEQILAAIDTEKADIITVQELTPATVKALRENVAQRYPYSILDLRAGTTGLISRYPIINSDWFRPAGRGRPVLHATLNANGVLIHILAVHPLPPTISWYKKYPLPTSLDDENQLQEAKDILRRVTLLQGPVLVMGDFNMTDQSLVYNLVSSVLKDSYREAGWGFGFTFPNNLMMRGIPVPGPFIRIDYIFHSDPLKVQYAQVNCNGGSDHCYLIVKLTRPTGK
ncbi:MAG TPA: endonuclease/exonuclease/phosphatase family protein [Anaerolineae bacterium]